MFGFLSPFLHDRYIKHLNDRPQKILKIITLILFGLSMLFSDNNLNNIKQEYKNGVLGDLYRSYQDFYENVELIQSETGEKVVILKQPEDYATSHYFGPDILPNRVNEDWNLAMEYYFKIDELRLEGDTIFKTGIHE